jgi:glycosyltransferase involved in cell wall biosynthesis
MRILFLSDAPETPDAGAAGTEFQTIEAMRKLGHEVDAVWSDRIPHRIKHGNLHYLLELPRAYRNLMLERMSSHQYDVIHATESHGYLAAKSLSAHSETVFIHRSHGVEMRIKRDLIPWRRHYAGDDRPSFKRLSSRILARCLTHNFRAIARYADGHIVSARQCRDFLHDNMGVPAERIAVIPQAPPELFLSEPPAPLTPDRLRRLLYVGQFAFFKAPALVAEAINRLAQTNSDLSFTWVCGKKDHSKVAGLLTSESRERVELRDWMPQRELIQVYDTHGVLLFPSFAEGFGKVFVEAMSRGLCVVASDNGGARDIITHRIDGLLTETGDIESIVHNSEEALGNLNLASKISQAAALSARAFTWARVASETAAFYEARLQTKMEETGRMSLDSAKSRSRSR